MTDQRNLSALTLGKRHEAGVEAHPSVKTALMVTSASWLCPICNRSGDRHLVFGGCFVGNVAREALALRDEAREAYRHGFADCYAKQVVAAMQDGTEERWCAVEGCQSEPTLIDLATGELVCRDHLDRSEP